MFKFLLLAVVFWSFQFSAFAETEKAADSVPDTAVVDSLFLSADVVSDTARVSAVFDSVLKNSFAPPARSPIGLFSGLELSYTSSERRLGDELRAYAPGFSIRMGLNMEKIFQMTQAEKFFSGTSAFISCGGNNIFEAWGSAETSFFKCFLAVKGMFGCLDYGLALGASSSNWANGKYRPARSYLFGMRIPVSDIAAIDYEYRREYVELLKLSREDYFYNAEFAFSAGALGFLSFAGDWFLENGRKGLLAAITMKVLTLGCESLMLTLEDCGWKACSQEEYLVLNHQVLAFSVFF